MAKFFSALLILLSVNAYSAPTASNNISEQVIETPSIAEDDFEIDHLSEFNQILEKAQSAARNTLAEKEQLLVKLATQVKEIRKKDNYLEYQDKLVETWRTIVDLSLSLEIQNSAQFEAPDVSNLNKKETELALEKLNSLSAEINAKKTELVNKQYQLLKNISLLRAQLVKNTSNQQLDSAYIKDIIREIKIVPFKAVNFLLDRKSEFQAHLNNGIAGIVPLFKSIIVLLLNFLLLPILMILIFKYCSKALVRIRNALINAKSQTNNRRQISFFLQVIEPYAPWALCYVLIVFIESYSADTMVRELQYILPYFRFFIIYRVFVVFLKGEFRRIVVLSDAHTLVEEKQKIEKSAKIIGLYFLFAFSIIYATETVVGKAYVYQMVSEFMWWIGAALMFGVATFWRDEIVEGISQAFRPNIATIVNNILNNKIGKILAFPALALLVGKFFLMGSLKLLSNFDFAKRSLARLSRRQMEAAGAKIQDTDIETLPEAYLEYFSLGAPQEEDLWVKPSNKNLDSCTRLINNWYTDKSEERSLAIYGEKGAGKSTLLLGIANSCKAKVINISVPPKLTTQKAALDFISNSLMEKPFEDLEQFTEWDKSASKTLLMLDNAHNFFLAEIGGFDGFKALIDFLNLRLDNLFVCTTFNIHSWNFLDSVFGRNRHFRTVMPIETWSQQDIYELINVRHKKSGFQLKYDPIVFAKSSSSQSDEFTTAEKKFFSILWEMSEGNPRAAIYYWLSSLRPQKGKLKVGLPYDREGSVFHDLQNNTYFVYASVVKHENLNSTEASSITDLPIGLVKYALNIGLEREFIDRDDSGRYRINPAWHGIVISFLKQRNFLYDE